MSDRNARGRFQKGNKGGPGRPPRVTEVDYLIALSDAVGPDRWRTIVDRAILDAENGDATARAWLASHLLPKAGSGVLEHRAATEAREDRMARGEGTMEDLMASLSFG